MNLTALTTFQRKLVFCNQMAQKLVHVTHGKKLQKSIILSWIAGLSGILHDIKILNSQLLYIQESEVWRKWSNMNLTALTTFQRKLVFRNQMAQKLILMNVLIHDHSENFVCSKELSC